MLSIMSAGMAAPILACLTAAASFYHFSPRVLISIHAVEGGAPGIVHHNTDGSQDLGVMQINTRWVPAIARDMSLTPDNVRARLIWDGCFNVVIAAAILRTYLGETRGDLMRAIGDYHSHTPALNWAYREKVLQAALAIFTSTGQR